MNAGCSTDVIYGQDYYCSHLGPPYDRSEPHWLRFFGMIADEIVSRLHPRRVLDVGCAKGFLVEALRDTPEGSKLLDEYSDKLVGRWLDFESGRWRPAPAAPTAAGRYHGAR